MFTPVSSDCVKGSITLSRDFVVRAFALFFNSPGVERGIRGLIVASKTFSALLAPYAIQVQLH